MKCVFKLELVEKAVRAERGTRQARARLLNFLMCDLSGV
jgi:hypothetical protein